MQALNWSFMEFTPGLISQVFSTTKVTQKNLYMPLDFPCTLGVQNFGLAELHRREIFLLSWDTYKMYNIINVCK